MIGHPPRRTASSSRVRYLLVFWPVTGTGDLSDGTMVFVSFYAYWHWIVRFPQSKPMDDSRLLYDVLVFPLVLVFFINPIKASEVDPGCIEFKPGDQPIHNTLLREGPSP